MAQGAILEPIAVDLNGLKVDELKQRFDKAAVRPQRLKMLYLTPSHQYPTGVVLALPRRLELLAWAKRTGTFLIEDDYDSEYRYKGRPIPALAGLDKGDSVIYIGTFFQGAIAFAASGLSRCAPGLWCKFFPVPSGLPTGIHLY